MFLEKRKKTILISKSDIIPEILVVLYYMVLGQREKNIKHEKDCGNFPRKRFESRA